MKVKEYENILKSNPIFNQLNFGDIFTSKWTNKSGYITIQNMTLYLLEQLPYQIMSDFLLYRTYSLDYLYDIDNVSVRKMSYLRTAYSQIQALAKTPNVSTNKTETAQNAAITQGAELPNQPSGQERPRRSVMGYLFGVSAEEVKSEMDQHFTALTDTVESEFKFERQVTNKLTTLLNQEGSEIAFIKERQDLLIQKINLDLLFNNMALAEKYIFFVQKNNMILDQLGSTYKKILEILVESLRTSDKKIQCGFSQAFGINASCLNLQGSSVEMDEN